MCYKLRFKELLMICEAYSQIRPTSKKANMSTEETLSAVLVAFFADKRR